MPAAMPDVARGESLSVQASRKDQQQEAEAAATLIQARIRGNRARALRDVPKRSFLLGSDSDEELSDEEEEDWEPPSTALWCLTVHMPVRKAAIHIMLHKAFDNIVLAIIVANSVAMALEDPLEDPDHPSALTRGLHGAELVFNIAFTVEMTVKIVAMGFLGQRNTYLRDAWNVMDFIILVTSWIPYLLPNIGGNASGLRTFRLLRPLRSINRFPGLKILVETILMAIPQLGNIMLLSSIYFLTFGIVGVQLWKGSFHNRCGSLQHVTVDGCNATVSGASCTTLQWLIAHGHQELHAQFVAHGYGDSSLFNSMSEEKVSQVLQNILPGVAGGVREELEIAIRIRDVMQKGAVCAAVADDNGGGHACAVYVVDAEDEQANGVGEAGFCNWDYAQELWTQEISGQWVYSPEKAAHEEQFAKMHYSVRVITAAYQFSPPRSTPS